MSDLFPLPNELSRAEYCKIYYHLELSEYFDLPSHGLLQLRRELQTVLSEVAAAEDQEAAIELQRLLQPPPSSDPVLRKQVKTPAPGLVLLTDAVHEGLYEPKQRLVLPVMFFGDALDGIEPFSRLLELLGATGLYKGGGKFRLEAIESEDAGGVRAMLWTERDARRQLAPPISDLYWWLQKQPQTGTCLEMRVRSPMRLLQAQKPLFSAGFFDMFPFALRRVTAMLAYHCHVEVVTDPAALLALAAEVEVVENGLRWQDWRPLTGERSGHDLGGLTGSLRVKGTALAELMWVLQLGALFGIGKGATYGAGRYVLRSH